MSIFEYLNLRSEWEEIVAKFDFGIYEYAKHGTVKNMHMFYDYQLVNNRFRKGYDRAVEIAQDVVDNFGK